MARLDDLDELATAVAAGDRRALSRAVTLVESGREDHRRRAADLLDRLAGHGRQALRIGLSGTPGVGKSTFIETLGRRLTGEGQRVAVLAVDPSSSRSGGSILGDKTRMPELARDPAAFIRPSPSRTHLGGVAARSRDAVVLCEAAGFDVVIVETVGVGQSETMVEAMTDVFVLLLAPGGGDELQGVKRGIMETADLILINKADGDMAAAAEATRADYAGALRLMRHRPRDPEGYPKALSISARDAAGLDAAWGAVTELAAWRRAEGHWDARRAEQAAAWFTEAVREGVLARLRRDDRLAEAMAGLQRAVADGQRAPAAAAAEVLDRLSDGSGS